MMITSGIKAQYTMGTTGMMNIPTAEMQQTGTFMIGGNYLPEELKLFREHHLLFIPGIELPLHLAEK